MRVVEFCAPERLISRQMEFCVCVLLWACVCAVVWEKTAPVLVPLKEMSAHTVFEINVWVLITPPHVMSGEGDWNHHIHLSKCSGFVRKISSVLLRYFSVFFLLCLVWWCTCHHEPECRAKWIKTILCEIVIQQFCSSCSITHCFCFAVDVNSHSCYCIVMLDAVCCEGCILDTGQEAAAADLVECWFPQREFTAFSIKQLACSSCLVIMAHITFWLCCCGCEYSFPLLYNMLTPHITVKSEEEGAIFTVVCACIFLLLERTPIILSKIAVHLFSSSHEWH